jgi:hypothetical protein
LLVCSLPARADGCGDARRHGVGHSCNIDGTKTVRSTAMGNTTDKMKKGVKDAASTVKKGVEKGKDAAVRAVDKGKAAAARGADKVQDSTDRAAHKVKHA